MPKKRKGKSSKLPLKNILLGTFFIITLVGLSAYMISGSTMSLSGYQSITAEWNQILWPNAQWGTETFQMDLSGSTFIWDADNIAPIADGWSDMNGYTGEIENPKFDRNLEYHDWWSNDTVTEDNPDGIAQHYEWAIDIYTVNVNFMCNDGGIIPVGVQVWAEFKNNVDTVFEVLGAEDAASYIIYAQTEEYTWLPETAPNHIILPTTANFDLHFLETSQVPPSSLQEGSDLNFDALTPYSHVAIVFLFSDFGKGIWDSDVVVNMVVELNVLTVGRFDYTLTYDAGGNNTIAPIGGLGIFDSIGAALDAGFSALADFTTDLLDSATGPLIMIAIIAVAIVSVVLIIRFGLFSRGSKQGQRG